MQSWHQTHLQAVKDVDFWRQKALQAEQQLTAERQQTKSLKTALLQQTSITQVFVTLLEHAVGNATFNAICVKLNTLQHTQHGYVVDLKAFCAEYCITTQQYQQGVVRFKHYWHACLLQCYCCIGKR